MLMADAQPDDSNCVFEGFDEFDFIFTAEEILAETSDPSNSGSAGTPDGLSCNDPYQHDFFNSDLDKEKSFKPPDGILEAIPGAAQDSCDPSSYLGGHNYKAGLGSECLFENSANLGTYFNVEFDYVTKENKPIMGPQSHASEWLTLSSSDHNLLSEGPNGGSFDLEHGFDNEQLQSAIPYHFTPYEIANQEAIRIQECKNYNNMYDPNGNEMELRLIERAFSHQTESKPDFNHCRSPKVRLQNEGRDSLSHMLIDEPVSSIDVYNSAYRSNMLNMGAKEINILPSPSMVFPTGTDATFIDTVYAKLDNGQDNIFPSAGNSVVGADGECDGDNLNHYLTGPVISSEEEYASCMEDEREDDMPNHQDGEESNLGTQEKIISFSAGPLRAADTSLSEISCVKLSSCQDTTLKSEASTQHFRSLMNKLPVSDTNVESVAVAPEQPAVCKPLMSSKRQKVSSKNGEIQLLESCKKNTPAVKVVSLRGSAPVDDDSDICILDDISDPRHLPIPLGIAKPYAPTQRVGCIDNSPYLGAGGMRFKAFDERLTFTIALQDLSQPKSESSPPDGQLAVPLLRHQRIALSWMVQKETTSLHCSGGILADDQGLGKTISTIALMLTERSPSPNSSSVIVKQAKFEALNLDDDDDEASEPDVTKQPAGSGPLKIGCSRREGSSFASVKGRPAAGTLIVCPTSVLRQWADELTNKVTGKANLSFLVYHGGNRTKDPEELAKYDVVLTTYAIVSMEVPKQPLVDKDDEEKGKADSSDVFTSRKRKDPTSSNKKKNMKDQAETFARPLARVVWFRVVLDEAQSIKNYRTQTARACWGLRAKRRWCLSGTPIQNAIDDLYSYFRFLRYDPYAIYKSFCAMIKSPINRNPTTGYKKLQAVLKTIMLRRTKGTLLDGEPIINLPPKSISLKKVDFSSLERSFYSRLEADSRAQFKEYADAGTVKQNYVNILLMLLRLRQACDHPLLVKGYDSSASWKSSVETAKKLPREKRVDLLNCLEACLAICAKCNDPPEDAVVTTCGHVFCNQCICEHLTGDEKLCPAANCKVHLSVSSVFSKITLRTSLVDQDGHDCPPHDSSPEPAPELSMENLSDSTKIKAALEILQALPKSQDANSKCCSTKTSEDSCGPENSHNAGAHVCLEDTHDEKQLSIGEKAIVFSQWTRMLDLLEIPLKNSSIQYRRLDGTMSVLARDKAVKDFNTLPEVTVMIMSLKAASLGLNMVAACHVLLLDLWWNPTTEDQAIDRAHRIGQTRPVTVSRLTIKDTVEDRILALQEKKRVMVASAFGEDETGGRQSRLTVEDLKYLFMV